MFRAVYNQASGTIGNVDNSGTIAAYGTNSVLGIGILNAGSIASLTNTSTGTIFCGSVGIFVGSPTTGFAGGGSVGTLTNSCNLIFPAGSVGIFVGSPTTGFAGGAIWRTRPV